VRRALGLISVRVLGTRYGLAALLAVVVLAVVGGARLLGGPGAGSAGPPPGPPEVAVQVSGADDGEAGPLPSPSPVTSPGAAAPERVAAAFASAWLDHRNVTEDRWLARLRPHATQSLADKLTGVDPAGVPAERVTGALRLLPRGESFVEAIVPVDSGTLRLLLIATDGRWFVDGVDWERA
jgi:hypothetical protein